MRKVDALDLADAPRADVGDQVTPTFRVVPPTDLWIDGKYQREISGRSIKLIQKIVSNWNWRAFKPPVAVEVDGRLELLDGQHTAIAAATHGDIDAIPVMVVEAEAICERANAFVQLNRDRLNVTGAQLHHAMVAAGDEDALTLEQVCSRAGVTILRSVPSFSRFKPRTTLAIKALQGLVTRRHAAGARRVLQICAQAELAPVSADHMRAVEHLMFAPEYKNDIDADRILLVLQSFGETIDAEARRYATERKLPVWRGLASVIFMNRSKRKAA